MTVSTFPAWIYNSSPIDDPFGFGERAVRFLRALKHPKSTAPGQRFKLDPWLERVVLATYGPRHPDGSRICKELWLQLPRGSRKTSIAAALALLHLLGPERAPAGQIIFAASDRAQAAIGFTEAADIVRQHKSMRDKTTVYDPYSGVKTIKSKLDGSTLKAVSSDGKAMHGTTPTFVLADEIHVWKGRELWEALRSGMTKRAGGLWVTATTAGRGREGLAYERYLYMRKIATGEIINPEILPIIFEPGEDDDWLDEKTWFKVNPGLIHGYPVLSELRSKAAEVKDNPAEAYSFRQYALNEWLGNSTAPLFNFNTYDAGEHPDDEKDLEKLPCFLGVDYATSGDLSAIVAAWNHPDGQVSIKAWPFVQGEGIEDRERLEQVPYAQWAKDGHIEIVPGSVVPQQTVGAKIKELCDRHYVQEVAYDPARFQAHATELLAEGVPMIEMRQGPLTMGPAVGELIRAVNGGLIRQDGHPVLRHHFDGVAAVENKTGLIWLDKQDKKRGHIDCAVAAAMAVGRARVAHQKKSRYSDPEVTGLAVI